MLKNIDNVATLISSSVRTRDIIFHKEANISMKAKKKKKIQPSKLILTSYVVFVQKNIIARIIKEN